MQSFPRSACLPCRALHKSMSRLSPELGREPGRGGVGEEKAAGEIKIGPHPVWINCQSLSQGAGLVKRS